jgi:[ribosomal protein S5]-alanine N-acetyltransferase
LPLDTAIGEPPDRHEADLDLGLGLSGVQRLEFYAEPRNEAFGRPAERVGNQREGLLRSWQAVGEERRDMYMYSLLTRDRPRQ